MHEHDPLIKIVWIIPHHPLYGHMYYAIITGGHHIGLLAIGV